MGRNHQKLNNCLEELRRKANLTQQELSEKAEVSRKSINAIENGIYVFNVVTESGKNSQFNVVKN